MPAYYRGQDFTLFATDPRVQVWPQTTFAYFTYSGVGPGATQIVFIETTAAGDNQLWLLGSNNVLSFAIKKTQFTGALRLEIDLGDGSLNQSFMFPLSGEGVIDTLSGFEIGGLAVRFQLVNGTDGGSDFVGWIQLRSW